jgi:predicted ATPase
MVTEPNQAGDRLSFGPFNLVASERLLTKNGVPVDLGARALDILVALISTPNEVVTKKDLMARVWPDVTVEEGSLRFHMTSLRKALGDGKDGARYITTLAGRGYCFVAPLSRASRQHEAPAALASFPHANLPQRLARMVGRDEDVKNLTARLRDAQLVTIVGPGGVGKTTVAIAAAHHVSDAFAGSVLFADFGMLSDPNLAATAISSMMGVSVQSEDATPSLLSFLKGKRILLVLDTCEHLVEAVARLATNIIEAAPQVHILATSREALRIDGEHIYRLDALAIPPEETAPTADTIRQFPATQLFLERAAASGARLDITDMDAPIVVDICRKLDGVPLAIELAARRVESHGIQQTAALLDQHLTLLWPGLRTAPPRQKTLQATLNWSYSLLSEVERSVLRRLAIFVGHFTLDAALDVVTSPTLERSLVFGAIDDLVAKSMLAVFPIGAMLRYRLLDTTRAYALEIGIDDADATDLAVRHANYYRRRLEMTGDEWESLPAGAQRSPYFADLNNTRAALEWCFGATGDVALGVKLAAVATPVFLTMSLLPECHRWSEQALLAIDKVEKGGIEEMQLQASLGLSLMYTRGHNEASRVALNRSIEIAKARGDHLNEVRLLGPLFIYYYRSGEFKVCLDHAERSLEIATKLGDPSATGLAQTLLGLSFSVMGELNKSHAALDTAIATGTAPLGGPRINFGFDQSSMIRVARIATLAMQGHVSQARTNIKEAFTAVEGTTHPVALAVVLNSAGALLLIGDLEAAEEHLDNFFARAQSRVVEPFLHVGCAFKAELAICRGEINAGIERLQSELTWLHAARFKLFAVRLQTVLARALAVSGRSTEALSLVDETTQLIDEKGCTCFLPELLRVRGSLLLEAPEPRPEDAEKCFEASLALARRQGARTWELRTATDLAAHWARQGRPSEARALLRPVFEQFTDGQATPDLKAASAILTSLA